MPEISKCGHCEGTKFELVTHGDVSRSTFRLAFIQCADCGAVAGVMESQNVAEMLHNVSIVLKRVCDRLQIDATELDKN